MLSHGTAEQVYLLLRLALAEHLAVPSETCPLILDDITVQSDRVRTEAIMRCLHVISRERQVIMFTLEEEVLAWAEGHLDSVKDQLVRLGVCPRNDAKVVHDSVHGDAGEGPSRIGRVVPPS
jgi:DNA repair exonuclease SbcCD ATPase subunit